MRIPVYTGGSRWDVGTLVGHALVDPEWAHLGDLRWRIGDGYAVRTQWHADRTREKLSMHRVVMGLGRGDEMQVDHINGDRLDNRAANLRLVTIEAQGQNKRSRKGSTSRFRGVARRRNRWQAYITVDGVRTHLGFFGAEEEAGAAARQARLTMMPWAVD